jgi:hypothetical protein
MGMPAATCPTSGIKVALIGRSSDIGKAPEVCSSDFSTDGDSVIARAPDSRRRNPFFCKASR